ncbi:hypothetical protein V6N11_001543 [Hibiscus sabdariffa]|uniref:Reverse transcriptase zinc-binding domain-containing protein n=1 Tax=Hibiscus sabdariffa TaxID=183260 RepID=A0ABR2S0A7_9ROSI
MADATGQWDWNRMSSVLPELVLRKIATIRPPNNMLGSDVQGWRWEQNWCFTTKSTYEALSNYEVPSFDFKWLNIWHLQVPQRVKVFVWLAVHDRLLTNAERFRRHLAISDRCT